MSKTSKKQSNTKKSTAKENVQDTAKLAKASHFDLTKCLLTCLNEREQDVLKRRHALEILKKETLESIGKGYQITRERVRQIERASLNKIKRLVDYRKVLHNSIDEIDQLLQKFGGIMSHKHLIEELARIKDPANLDHLRERNHLHFILDNFMPEFFYLHSEGDLHGKGWSKHKNMIQSAREIIRKVEDFLTQHGQPISYQKISVKLGEPVDSIHSHLHLSKNIDINAFGLWGLGHWSQVNPKRMADRIYLVLAKYGKPLHYKDIALYITKHYGKKTHPPTVHNELIADSRFVLVGRGIYALREWGYISGTVKDVVAAILAKSDHPITRAEIVEAVQKQRLVARSTILLALNSATNIKRVGKDKYKIAE